MKTLLLFLIPLIGNAQNVIVPDKINIETKKDFSLLDDTFLKVDFKNQNLDTCIMFLIQELKLKNVTIVYSPSAVDSYKANLSGIYTLRQILDYIFKNTNLTYLRLDYQIIVYPKN